MSRNFKPIYTITSRITAGLTLEQNSIVYATFNANAKSAFHLAEYLDFERLR